MFEVGWLELLVIAVVLIVVVGPKDLPGMLRTFGRVTTQLRRMAGDFRKQFDDALREAEMDDVRKAASDLKKLDPRNDIRKAMNPMKSVGDEIRSSLKAATQAPQPKVPSADAGARPMDDADPAAAVTPAEPAAASPIAEPAPVATATDATPPTAAATDAAPLTTAATDAAPGGSGEQRRNAGEVA
ncbi:sec-independent protein translocase protein TatB [Aureimonas altamirensis DSM 21988]|uniref:Sec-independent protein translocase protein TatB n=2 Tax=Aureimonas altamirensis TaxID=370622 RepID=A0A0P0YYQ7_9HYPH|nr:Sec-independent protein translocase protein TatB [Aureimonas altamirensis]BAT26445.1 sec-independent translocase [Aureimonas altamirensis]SHJ48220.1 sec-independent protein translocase protein TatB [Aureimonas altamirensis DSM 21988]